VRMKVLGDSGQFLPSGPGANKVPDEAQRADMLERLDVGLRRGAVGVGMGLAYTPAASATEALQVYRVAARHKVPVYIHLRGGMSGLIEAIGDAAASGAPLHVVHVNSSGGQQVASFLEAIEGARARGLDVTTESYPYTAGSSRIESALYADWESWPDERFARLQWVATGERLTRETFRKYRAMGGGVISHGNTEEAVTAALKHPLTAIASDGGRVAEGVQSHPRSAGTYSRILGHYVREVGALDLRTALAKMTVMPARRLEARIPDMKDRGRIRVGAWADVTVFDPRTIIDRSTYTDGTRASEGVRHVFVNGVAVVKDGAVVDGVAPGRPIRAATADTLRAAR
jgi:hypothetical protein